MSSISNRVSRPIELRQLKYFVAVAEELHFGRAAQRLNMAQPPLSQQIRRLESQLQVRLFDRHNRSVRLTSAGTALFAKAGDILRDVSRAVDATLNAARGETGSLGIGFGFSATYTLLPALVSRYRKMYPNVQVDLFEMTISQQIEALAKSEIDVGVLRLPLNVATLATKIVLVESLVLAIPKEHALAQRGTLKVRELAHEQFVMAPPNRVGFFDLIKSICRSAGFEPHIAQHATGLHTALGLVSVGMGIAIVPQSLTQTPVRNVIYKPLVDAPKSQVALAWRADDRSPIVKSFIALAGKRAPGTS